MSRRDYEVVLPTGSISDVEDVSRTSYKRLQEGELTGYSPNAQLDTLQAIKSKQLADLDSSNNTKFLGDARQKFASGASVGVGIGVATTLYEKAKSDSVVADIEAERFLVTTVATAVGSAIVSAGVGAGIKAVIGGIDGPLPFADIAAGIAGAFAGSAISNALDDNYQADILKKTTELEQKNASFARSLNGARLNIG